MYAVVLCAGWGRRLAPLTDQAPKPTLPLLGVPLVRFAFATAARAGATSLGVNVAHLPHAMEEVARREASRLKLAVTVSREESPQGTGGGVRGLLRDEPMLVLNGDTLFEADLSAVWNTHLTSHADATLVLTAPREGFNRIELDTSGNFRRVVPAAEPLTAGTQWHFPGASLWSPSVKSEFPAEGAFDLLHDLLPRLIARGGRVRGAVLPGPVPLWSDVGTTERYLDAQAQLLACGGRVSGLELFAGCAVRAGSYCHPRALVEPNVQFDGVGFVDAEATVGAGARLGQNVAIGRGAQVGAGATLQEVAVFPGAVVAAGARLSQAIVAADGVVLLRSGDVHPA